MNYVSKAQGNYNTVGASLGIAALAGEMLNIFGNGTKQPQSDGDRPVTRYEMGLYQQIADEKAKNAALEAKSYTDAAVGAQAVWNATQQGIIGCLQGQIAQLQSMTKLVIPNSSVSPGWGPMDMFPAYAEYAGALKTTTQTAANNG